MKTVVGLFDSASEALNARHDLIGSGIESDRISVVTKPPGDMLFPAENTQIAHGAGIGATAGAIAGGAAGLLASLGQLFIPGVGPLLAAGSIVAILTGAGIGAAAGGVIGALVGLGIPREEAEVYAEGINRGGTLLSVDSTDNDADRIAAVLSQHHAVDIDQRSLEWESAGWKRPPIVEEKTAAAPAAKSAAGRDQQTRDPSATPSSRGVDRPGITDAGASTGSASTGQRKARIYNPK